MSNSDQPEELDESDLESVQGGAFRPRLTVKRSGFRPGVGFGGLVRKISKGGASLSNDELEEEELEG